MDDISAKPSPSSPDLTIIGDLAVDMVMGSLAQWPQIGTETLMPHSEMRAGGSAGNAALALRYLNAPARLISAVGSDALGQWLADQFAGDGLITVSGPTSLSVGILHDGGERSFFTTRGHMELQAPPASLPPPPHPAAVVLLTGVFLLPRLRAVYGELIHDLKALGYRVALDTGWPPGGWDASATADVKSWLGACDHVLLNELEITQLAGTADLNTAMVRISALMPPEATLVAKVGARGAVGWCGREIARAKPPQSDTIIDTIGAGDAFNAGYLLARTQGADLRDALVMGSDTATRIIAHFPRQPVRTAATAKPATIMAAS